MPEFKVTSPEGQTYKVNAPEGTTEDAALAHLQEQLGGGTAAPAQGMTATKTGQDQHPRWAPFHDIKQAFSSAWTGLKDDVTNAFSTGRDKAAQQEGLGAELKHEAGKFGSALKIPFDVLGVAGSPVTGLLHAGPGSALSYLPGVNKQQADEGVDTAAMGAAPARGGKIGGLPGMDAPQAPPIAKLFPKPPPIPDAVAGEFGTALPGGPEPLSATLFGREAQLNPKVAADRPAQFGQSEFGESPTPGNAPRPLPTDTPPAQPKAPKVTPEIINTTKPPAGGPSPNRQAIPEGYNFIRDQHSLEVDKSGVARPGKGPIPEGYDPKRNVERAPSGEGAMPLEQRHVPGNFDPVTGKEIPIKEGVNQVAAKGMGLGYKFPPAMVKDGSGIAGKLAGAEAGKTKLQQAASVHNQRITDGFGAQELGLSPKTPLTSAVFEAVRNKASQAYAAIAKAMPSMQNLGADTEWQEAINGLGGRLSDAAKEFPNYYNRNKDISDLQSDLRNKTDLSTQAALDHVRQLRADANKQLKTIGPDSPEKHAYGLALRQAAEALDSLVERQLMQRQADLRLDPRTGTYHNAPDPALAQMAQQYRQARELIAKSYDVEGATDAAGHINASGIARLAKHRPLSGRLADIAEQAQNAPQSMQNPSRFGGKEDISVLDFFGAAATIHHPGVAATLLARSQARAGLLSGPYQRHLIRPPPATSPALGAVPSIAGAVNPPLPVPGLQPGRTQ